VTDLSPRARALFEAGRQALQPNAADRERVLSALSARVGLEPEGGGTGGAPTATSGLGWPGVTAIVVGLAVAGAGVFQVVRPAARAAVASAASSAPVLSSRPEPTPVGAALQAVAPVAPGESVSSETLEPPRESKRSAASTQPSDRLAEEVAILSEAERELHAGQYQSALGLLDEHRHKFPNGTLAQERMAARVQALCGLGRVSEAQTALARLRQLSPHSPHEEPAREACAPKN
jgi:hypothetical protein